MRSGRSAASASYDSQSRPVAFVSTIPACLAKRVTTSRPASDLKSTAIDRLALFMPVHIKLVPDGASGQRPTSAAPPSGSILMTSAPSCASVMPPSGAATKLEISTSRRPSSNFIVASAISPAAPLTALARRAAFRGTPFVGRCVVVPPSADLMVRPARYVDDAATDLHVVGVEQQRRFSADHRILADREILVEGEPRAVPGAFQAVAHQPALRQLRARMRAGQADRVDPARGPAQDRGESSHPADLADRDL